MRVPNFSFMVEMEELRHQYCKNCGRHRDYHITVGDKNTWGTELVCVVKYPGKSDKYESS